MLLASLADLAVLTRLPANNPRVELALRRASSRFEGSIEYSLGYVENDVFQLNGDGTRILQVPALPIIGAVSVQINNEADPVLSDDFEINRGTGQLSLVCDYWPAGLGNIEVTYSHGYEDSEDVPGDIQDAVLEHAVTICLTYAHIQQNSAGSAQESYIQAAMVGVTQKWVDTVERYKIGGNV